MHRKKIATVLADQRFGVNEFDDGIWPLSFMHYDLGYFDLEQRTLQTITTRSARGCHHVLGTICYPCLRVGHGGKWRRGRDSNPRWACTHAAFRVRCIRPLCHLSAVMVRRCRRGALDNGWADRLQGPICPAIRLLVGLAARLSVLPRAWPERSAARYRPFALTRAEPSVRDSAQSAWRVLPRRLFFEPAD